MYPTARQRIIDRKYTYEPPLSRLAVTGEGPRRRLYPWLAVGLWVHEEQCQARGVAYLEHERIAEMRRPLPCGNFDDWWALGASLRFASEIQETHGTCKLTLISELRSVQALKAYCDAVAATKALANSRGHDYANYKYYTADRIVARYMAASTFATYWWEIWRLVWRFMGRIELLCQGNSWESGGHR